MFGTFAKALLALPGRDKEFVTVQILPDEDNELRKEAARMALCLQRVVSPGVRLAAGDCMCLCMGAWLQYGSPNLSIVGGTTSWINP